jgi:hypothetical protein
VVPPEVLGPLGLTFAAVVGVIVLWRSHERADRDMQTDRDYWRSLALTGSELAEKATTFAIRKRAGDG